MASGRDAAAHRQLAALYVGASTSGLSDARLLERFAAARGSGPAAEAAFAALVDRHGPAVLRACRATLGDEHAAHDAFQATFLVLARKAGSVRVADSAGPWLLGVAARVSARARAAEARRLRHERRRAQAMTDVGGRSPLPEPDLALAVRAELARLPDGFRAAVLLCDLEGLSHEEAAGRLGWPVGTVKSRQARGRARLRVRLARLGLAPSALAALAGDANAAMPPALAAATVGSACRFVAGTATGACPAALALARGMLMKSFFCRLWFAAGIVLLAGVTATGFGRASRPGDDGGSTPAPVAGKGSEIDGGRTVREILGEAAASARELDHEMRVHTLIAIARAQARAGDRDGARRTLGWASEATERHTTAQKVGERVYIAEMIAQVSKDLGGRDLARDEILRAADLASAIEETSVRFATLGRVALAQARIGDAKSADANLEAMSRIAFARLDRNERYHALLRLVESQTRAGRFDAAFRTVESLGDGDDYTRGRLLATIVKSAAPAAVILDPLAMFAPLGTVAERLRVLRSAEEIAAGFAFAEEKIDAELAGGFARLGDFDAAFSAYRRYGTAPVNRRDLIELGGRPDILGEIGQAQALVGKDEDARATLREAHDLAVREAAVEPELAYRLASVAYARALAGDMAGARESLAASGSDISIIIGAHHVARWIEGWGDRDTAQALLRWALEVAEREVGVPATRIAPPSPVMAHARADVHPGGRAAEERLRRQDELRARIAAIRAGLGDAKGALDAYGAVDAAPEKDQAAAAIAEALARGGDPAGALAWARTLEPPVVRLQALRGLAEGFAAAE